MLCLLLVSCSESRNKSINISIKNEDLLKEVTLDAKLDDLTENQKNSFKYFVEASKYVDSMFYYENLSNYKEILADINDAHLRKMFEYNFGPWLRFKNNEPFLDGFGVKPLGSNFYPNDMTISEFEKFTDNCKLSHYSFIRRDANKKLICVPYSQQFEAYNQKISDLLNKAASASTDSSFAEYLRQKAVDLQHDNFAKSDSLLLQLKTNKVEFIIGPLEIYDDKLLNLKAEHLSLLLLRDSVWSEKMEKYRKWLIFLQKALPVPVEYRAEEPGISSNISVYDAIYFGGSSTAGGNIISLTAPFDDNVLITQGTKNFQFKNVIEYKYQHILKPIANLVLTEDAKSHSSSEAFFANTVIFEMSNSLGIRNTLEGGSVRNALKDYYTISNWLKNCGVTLFIAEKLCEVNELHNSREIYTTFVVNLLRIIRYGQENDYAKSYLVFYNFLVERGAISYADDDKIEINYEKMKKAKEELVTKIIIYQGDGDYKKTKKFIDSQMYIDENLTNLINKINKENIPIDIKIKQNDNFAN